MKALHLVVISAALVGCGDGGPGNATGFSPPARGGSTTFVGTGTDKSGGGDKGGGVAPAIGAPPAQSETRPVQTAAPRTCSTNEQCSGGRCVRAGNSGYCLQLCEGTCSAGYECAPGEGGSYCFALCNTATDCPSVSGLTAMCALADTGQYCFWGVAEAS